MCVCEWMPVRDVGRGSLVASRGGDFCLHLGKQTPPPLPIEVDHAALIIIERNIHAGCTY